MSTNIKVYCTNCGEKWNEKFFNEFTPTCQMCLKEHRIKMDKKRKVTGILCAICLKERKFGHILCQDHLNAYAQIASERFDIYKWINQLPEIAFSYPDYENGIYDEKRVDHGRRTKVLPRG